MDSNTSNDKQNAPTANQSSKDKTLADQLIDKLRNHPIISFVIVAGVIVIAIKQAAESLGYLYGFAIPKPMPQLEIAFLSDKTTLTEMEVHPEWNDPEGAGFSRPIPVKIAVRNVGTATATNVKIRLIYVAGVIMIERTGGVKTEPALLGNIMNISGVEFVSTFSVSRIDPSKVAEVLDVQTVRVRVKERFGLPIMDQYSPVILPTDISFRHSIAQELGSFPIEYVISYSESDKANKGALILRIPGTLIASKQKVTQNYKLKFISKQSSLKLEKAITSNSRHLPFPKGQHNASLLMKGKSLPGDQVVDGVIVEAIAENFARRELYFRDTLTLVEIDDAKDGAVDRVYLRDLSSAEENWFHSEPDKPYPFIPVDHIIDFTKMGEVAWMLGSGPK